VSEKLKEINMEKKKKVNDFFFSHFLCVSVKTILWYIFRFSTGVPNYYYYYYFSKFIWVNRNESLAINIGSFFDMCSRL
jgi:hypothetical protein